MAGPYINMYYTKTPEGEKKDLDFKDRSPENQVAIWKNKSNKGGFYYKMTVVEPGEYTGFINKYFDDAESEPKEEW